MGFIVLDVDYKSGVSGFDALACLGLGILPDTPLSHTPSGGLHIFFDAFSVKISNTQGTRGRGIGRGLDWRGEGGYVILPSPESGYHWDEHANFATLHRLAPVPPEILPRERKPLAGGRPVRPVVGLSPYAEAALDSACHRIIVAPNGQQEVTINGESFSIGSLAGAGGIPVDFACCALRWAAQQIPSYDPRRPWRGGEPEAKVERAFNQGMRHPRGACHAS